MYVPIYVKQSSSSPYAAYIRPHPPPPPFPAVRLRLGRICMVKTMRWNKFIQVNLSSASSVSLDTDFKIGWMVSVLEQQYQLHPMRLSSNIITKTIIVILRVNNPVTNQDYRATSIVAVHLFDYAHEVHARDPPVLQHVQPCLKP